MSDPYLTQYQTSSSEQNLFITRIAGLSSSDATGYYGSTITFQNLIGEVGNNADDIAMNLSGLLSFTPVLEPSTFGMAAVASIAALYAYRRSRRARFATRDDVSRNRQARWIRPAPDRDSGSTATWRANQGRRAVA